MKFHITDMIEAEAPFDPGGACLALAERYQAADKLEAAIGLVQQLHEASPTDEAVALSLADLLMADDDHEGVLEVVKGFTNDSDLGAALLHIRGRALAAMGMETAALEMYRDALAKSSRDAELLKAIRYDRALAYLAAGQKGRAKADFERLIAADSGYLDVRDRLAALTA
jgi:tetratricopeptide (TPR) repeat protein